METALHRDLVGPIRSTRCQVSIHHWASTVISNPVQNLICEYSKDAPDQSLMDAVTAIIYAAPHTELKGETISPFPAYLRTY